MSSKPDDMEAEAGAVRRVLELALGNRTSRSVAEYLEKRVRSAASRLEDGARIIREREKVR